MEALQILKYRFKKEQLSFTGELLTSFNNLAGISPELGGKGSLGEHLKKGHRCGADDVTQRLFNWDDEIE